MANGVQLPDFPDIVASLGKEALTWTIALPAGVTFTGSPTITVSTVARRSASGASDPSPQSRISGATVGADSTSIQAWFTGGVGGVQYLFTISCARTDTGIFAGFNHMNCVAPA